jgi:hypothetical protein
VLAAEDPVPPVDPREEVQADLALFDPARDLELDDLPQRHVVPVGPGPVEHTDEALAAFQGPGGLPLLATALIAGPIAAPADDAGPGEDSDVPEAAPRPVTLAPLVSWQPVERPTSEESLAALAQPERETGSRRIRRTSILPGVAVAFALGSGLMLPDLASAFSFPAKPRTRLRLGLIRRVLRRRLARS